MGAAAMIIDVRNTFEGGGGVRACLGYWMTGHWHYLDMALLSDKSIEPRSMRGNTLTAIAVDADRGTIHVGSLTETYPGPDRDLKVLDEVSVAAERSSCIALRGVSGSGKSTLLNILGGIEEFDSGELEVSGVDLGSLPRMPPKSGKWATALSRSVTHD